MRFTVLGLTCFLLHAQPPAIGQNGIFNSASHIPLALTGGALAQGSRFTIEGVRLSGGRVFLKHDERSILLPALSVEAQRIETWMPQTVPLGPATVVVESAAGSSKPFAVQIVPSQPGLFSVNDQGWGPGRIDQFDASRKRAPNRIESPARPGQMVELLATGIGSGRGLQVNVGGRAATVAAVHASETKEFDSIRFLIPPGVPQGCYVPVYAGIAGAIRSNVVTIAIAPEGTRCKTPPGWPRPVENGAQTGTIGLSRLIALGADQPLFTVDEAFAMFAQEKESGETNRLLLIPPAGTCTSYTSLYYNDSLDSVAAAVFHPGAEKLLDAGESISISGASGEKSVPRLRNRPGMYWTRMGVDDSVSGRRSPLFLNAPQYLFRGSGSREIAPFSGTLPGVPSIDWINRANLFELKRPQGLKVAWRGAPKDAIVLVMGASFDPVSTAGSVFVCAAQPEAGEFQVRPEVLAHFPGSGEIGNPVHSGVGLIAVRIRAEKLSAPGLTMRLGSIIALLSPSVYR